MFEQGDSSNRPKMHGYPFSGTFKENFSWFLSRVSEHPFKQNKNVKQHDYMYLYCLLKCAKINLFSITYFQYI